MRRAAVATIILAALLLAGCGYQGTAAPTAKKVVGQIPTKSTSNTTGTAAKGKTLFTSQGCGGCHTFKPAATNGQTGPNLDNLPSYAKKANQGSVEEFTRESIVNPSAYVEKGYPDVMPKSYGQTLSDQQVADLVAFLTQNSG